MEDKFQSQLMVISFGELLKIAVQKSYSNLRNLQQKMQNMRVGERKKQLTQYLSKTRMIFLEILIIERWSKSSVGKIEEVIRILRDLESFAAVPNHLYGIPRGLVPRLKQPKYQVVDAINVLKGGNSETCPTSLRCFVPIKITKEEIEIGESFLENVLGSFQKDALGFNVLERRGNRLVAMMNDEFEVTLEIMVMQSAVKKTTTCDPCGKSGVLDCGENKHTEMQRMRFAWRLTKIEFFVEKNLTASEKLKNLIRILNKHILQAQTTNKYWDGKVHRGGKQTRKEQEGDESEQTVARYFWKEEILKQNGRQILVYLHDICRSCCLRIQLELLAEHAKALHTISGINYEVFRTSDSLAVRYWRGYYIRYQIVEHAMHISHFPVIKIDLKSGSSREIFAHNLVSCVQFFRKKKIHSLFRSITNAGIFSTGFSLTIVSKNENENVCEKSLSQICTLVADAPRLELRSTELQIGVDVSVDYKKGNFVVSSKHSSPTPVFTRSVDTEMPRALAIVVELLQEEILVRFDRGFRGLGLEPFRSIPITSKTKNIIPEKVACLFLRFPNTREHFLLLTIDAHLSPSIHLVAATENPSSVFELRQLKPILASPVVALNNQIFKKVGDMFPKLCASVQHLVIDRELTRNNISHLLLPDAKINLKPSDVVRHLGIAQLNVNLTNAVVQIIGAQSLEIVMCLRDEWARRLLALNLPNICYASDSPGEQSDTAYTQISTDSPQNQPLEVDLDPSQKDPPFFPETPSKTPSLKKDKKKKKKRKIPDNIIEQDPNSTIFTSSTAKIRNSKISITFRRMTHLCIFQNFKDLQEIFRITHLYSQILNHSLSRRLLVLLLKGTTISIRRQQNLDPRHPLHMTIKWSTTSNEYRIAMDPFFAMQYQIQDMLNAHSDNFPSVVQALLTSYDTCRYMCNFASFRKIGTVLVPRSISMAKLVFRNRLSLEIHFIRESLIGIEDCSEQLLRFPMLLKKISANLKSANKEIYNEFKSYTSFAVIPIELLETTMFLLYKYLGGMLIFQELKHHLVGHHENDVSIRADLQNHQVMITFTENFDVALQFTSGNQFLSKHDLTTLSTYFETHLAGEPYDAEKPKSFLEFLRKTPIDLLKEFVWLFSRVSKDNSTIIDLEFKPPVNRCAVYHENNLLSFSFSCLWTIDSKKYQLSIPVEYSYQQNKIKMLIEDPQVYHAVFNGINQNQPRKDWNQSVFYQVVNNLDKLSPENVLRLVPKHQ